MGVGLRSALLGEYPRERVGSEVQFYKLLRRFRAQPASS
jgi:hypothetical protein